MKKYPFKYCNLEGCLGVQMENGSWFRCNSIAHKKNKIRKENKANKYIKP